MTEEKDNLQEKKLYKFFQIYLKKLKGKKNGLEIEA
jgi:hypothetical protein